MPPARNKDGLLARVNFPLYTLQMLTSRHVLVAGGGGTAKTGIANGFEIFELSHNGNSFIAKEVIRHETGSNVVMNCAVYSNNNQTYVVAGQESHCQLYKVKTSIVDHKDVPNGDSNQNNETLRHRKQNENKDSNSEHVKYPTRESRTLKFELVAGDSIQTDFSKEEPLQKVVRLSHSGHIMATGGTDGHVRLWKFPHMIQNLDISAHNKEVDDIDFSPNDEMIITISKDGTCKIWNVDNGKLNKELKWTVPSGSKYAYKRCRFGKVEDDLKKTRLFTLSNPIGRAGKLKAYLQFWNPNNGELITRAECSESLASLAVRDDGRFVGVGTMFSGSVCVYVAFSLQKVLQVNGAHNMFVTGIEFLPVNKDNYSVTSDAEAAIVSISVDNRVCIHSLHQRRSLPMWLVILFIIFTLFFTFLTCSYIGL